MADLSETKHRDQLVDQFSFSLPDGDAGVVESQKFVKFFAEGNTLFQPENEIRFVLDAGSDAIDPMQSWITCKLKVTVDTPLTDAGGMGYIPIGTQGLISRLRITTMNGVDIEDIEDYNRLAGCIDMYTLSDEWKRDEGSVELYPVPPNAVPELNSILADTNSITTAYAANAASGTTSGDILEHPSSASSVSYTRRLWQPFQSAYRECVIRLRHSAIFGGKSIIPSEWGHLRVRLSLAPSAMCFRYGVGFHQECLGGAAVSAVQRFGGGFWAETKTISYEIKDPVFNCRTLKLSPHLKEAMTRAVNGAGLPKSITTYHVTRFSVPADNLSAPLSVTVPKTVANAQSAFMWFSEDAGATDTAINAFECYDHELAKWQFRLGTQFFPLYQVDNPMDGYLLTKFAIPEVGDKKASVSMVRYDPRLDVQGSIETPYKAASAETRYGDVACNCVVRGVSFQSIKGMALSGMTTNSGSQVQVQMQWDRTGTDSSLSANQRIQAYVVKPCTGYVCLAYTRLILCGPNQQVDFRE